VPPWLWSPTGGDHGQAWTALERRQATLTLLFEMMVWCALWRSRLSRRAGHRLLVLPREGRPPAARLGWLATWIEAWLLNRHQRWLAARPCCRRSPGRGVRTPPLLILLCFTANSSGLT